MVLDEGLYKSLHDDLEICRDYIRQIAIGMIKGNVSKYPIFIATRGETDFDLGLPIISRNDFDISWNFSASHLEDFVNKGIVSKNKTEDFIKTYKNPDKVHVRVCGRGRCDEFCIYALRAKPRIAELIENNRRNKFEYRNFYLKFFFGNLILENIKAFHFTDGGIKIATRNILV